MSDSKPTGPSRPRSYRVGQRLDWDAPWTPVRLYVELPFWLMVPDCQVNVTVGGHRFPVEVKGQYFEVHVQQWMRARRSCVHIGPPIPATSPLQAKLDRLNAGVLPRKCRTVLRIQTRCNADVLNAYTEGGPRRNEARQYLIALCSGHIPVVNALVDAYRTASYDSFAYELSPWDIPVWFVDHDGNSHAISLLLYSEHDVKPNERTRDGNVRVVQFGEPEQVTKFLVFEPTPGEPDLLDAMNLMQRGDYAAAVRRIVTAIEAVLEYELRRELAQYISNQATDEWLKENEQRFDQRLEMYQGLTGRVLHQALLGELERTRDLRHAVVHRARRIEYDSRGEAQRSVDTGRWIFNWFENRDNRRDVREGNLALKGIMSHVSLFRSVINEDGIVVQAH
jgi:hypothetical protein